MLSRVVKEHQERQVVFREQQERKRRVALDSVQKCSDAMVDSLNSSVEKAYENQRKLDREAKALQSHSSRFIRQTTHWLNLVEGFHKNLKGLGDLEQWAKTIENDMQVVVTNLEYAYRGSGEVHVLHEDQEQGRR
jgi:chromosome condensin MukBEF ATPase and DNA-binding subunit MukB